VKRLFAAIMTDPGPEFLHGFRSIKSAMVQEKIKWVDEKNIHLTVMFFGETREELIPEIGGIIHRVSRGMACFSFRFTGLGIFGSRYNPRVIWSGIQPHQPLTGLMNILQEEFEPAGFPCDRRNPVPHLTLGRIKNIRDKQGFQHKINEFRNLSSLPMVADRIILFESILQPAGPVYTSLQEFPFGS
jgi:2'-5' RNA ligase